MELFVSIGTINDFQQKKIDALTSRYDLKVTHEVTDETSLILTTRWHETYLQKNVEAVFVPYTGLNRFPLEQLADRGVQIFNTHAKAKLVAERALALTLSVMGKIHLYHSKLLNENSWMSRDNWGIEFWNSLQNKRCGIIGMGHIGKALQAYLKPFNCSIVNLDRDKHLNMATDYYGSIERLIPEVDVLFLTCALNDATRHLINMNNVHLLKDKVVINVARGEVIEEEALYRSLEDKIVLGAGIDVWYQYPTTEPCPPSKYHLDYNNLVMSPHASCHAVEFQNSYYEDIFNKIEDYIKNR